MKNVFSENVMKYVIGPRNGGAALENEKVQTDPLLHFPLNQNMCLHVQSHTYLGNAFDLHGTVSRVLRCHLTCHGTNHYSLLQGSVAAALPEKEQ